MCSGVVATGRRATLLYVQKAPPSIRRLYMYEKPEITKHDDLSQITFSSH